MRRLLSGALLLLELYAAWRFAGALEARFVRWLYRSDPHAPETRDRWR